MESRGRGLPGGRQDGCSQVGPVGAIGCKRVGLCVRDLGRAQLGDCPTLCGLDGAVLNSYVTWSGKFQNLHSHVWRRDGDG